MSDDDDMTTKGRRRRAGLTERRPMKLPRRRSSQFEEFAATHGAALVRLAFVVCGDRERAQDAGQEALIRVYQRWPRLTDPLAYARRTVINATRDDWRRAQRRDRAYETVRVVALATVADHPQERVLERDALMGALDHLPHHQRAVIVLRYGSQLSEAETAATLEIPIGTVKSQTARALARLREELSADLVAAHEETRCA